MPQRQFKNLTEAELFVDWLRWIERAYQEAIRQGWRHKMFRMMRGIYEQNADLRSAGGFFLTWAADNYVDASAIALRRELDTQPGTENLFHLLCEMRERPTVMSRARFRETWSDEDDTAAASSRHRHTSISSRGAAGNQSRPRFVSTRPLPR